MDVGRSLLLRGAQHLGLFLPRRPRHGNCVQSRLLEHMIAGLAERIPLLLHLLPAPWIVALTPKDFLVHAARLLRGPAWPEALFRGGRRVRPIHAREDQQRPHASLADQATG